MVNKCFTIKKLGKVKNKTDFILLTLTLKREKSLSLNFEFYKRNAAFSIGILSVILNILLTSQMYREKIYKCFKFNFLDFYLVRWFSPLFSTFFLLFPFVFLFSLSLFSKA